jgi:hypothetical protein
VGQGYNEHWLLLSFMNHHQDLHKENQAGIMLKQVDEPIQVVNMNKLQDIEILCSKIIV